MLNRKLLPAMTTAALVALSGFSSQLFAADGAGTASVVIVAPLDISQTTGLNFGTVSPDATDPTSVVLTSGGAISSPDGAGLFGGHAAGSFTVSGGAGAVYTVSDPGTVQLDGANGLDASSFTFTSANTPACNDVAAGSCTPTLTGGTDTLTVGATLSVPANHPAQVPPYVGNYTLTVQYQ